MRNVRCIALVSTLLLSLWASTASYGQGHNIRVKVHGMSDSTLILGYYHGTGRYVVDSARQDAHGQVVFRADTILPSGMYLVLIPGVQVYDIMLDEHQKVNIELDTADVVGSAKVSGSSVTSDFADYQRFMVKMQKEAKAIAPLDSLAKVENPDKPQDTASYKKARQIGEHLDSLVIAHQQQVLAKHKGDVLGQFVQMLIPIKIPEYTPPASVTNVDSAKWVHNYYYNRLHYLDNLSLSSPAMIRTPLEVQRVDNFLDKMLPQLPDTLCRYVDTVLSRASGNAETFRFFLSHLLDKYQLSEIIGMDALVVHIGENYYLKGRAPWTSEETLGKIRDRVKALKPNLIGNKAPNFTVEQLDGRPFELAKLKAKATVLIFWEPSCSHCKVAVPKLDSVAKIYEPLGLRVVAFMTQGDGPAWQKYVEEHKLERWINVWDPYRKTGFHDLYDIYSTPVIYILDADQKIVVKRIGVESVGLVLDDLLKPTEEKK